MFLKNKGGEQTKIHRNKRKMLIGWWLFEKDKENEPNWSIHECP